VFVFSGAKASRTISVISQAALVGFSFYLFLLSSRGSIYTVVGGYDGFLGIILRADYLSGALVLLTTFICLIVAFSCMHERGGRIFWFLLFLFEASLIGLFLTRDFFNAFVLVEVGTVVVTFLLMYDRKRRRMYHGMTYLMINIVVMQFYLFGIGYLYMLAGTLDMVGMTEALSALDPDSLRLPNALIMTAIASKCSLLPLITWLPKVNSMPGARTPVAALVSGLHIKGGVYLFMRFQDTFPPSISHFGGELFMVIGLITAVVAIVFALAQKDIKLILAYSNIAQAGLIMVGLNMGVGTYSWHGGPALYMYYGAIFHIINHALFKVALFICAGMIFMRYKTQNIDNIRGLWKASKPLSIATAIAIFGIIGAPLFNGFISKYFIMYSIPRLMEIFIIIINLGTILVFVKFSAIFFGKPASQLIRISTEKYRIVSVYVLGAVCLVLGIFGSAFMEFAFRRSFGGHVDGTILGRIFIMDPIDLLRKVGIFALSAAAAVLLTKHVIKDGEMLKPLRNFNMSFAAMCVSLGLFFALVLVVV
jgi:multicomponent Na+:H+ antiporter subunit D